MAKAKSKGAKSTAKSFENAYSSGKTGFESAAKSFESFFNSKSIEDAANLSKQNLDAVLETSSLWAQGCQEISNAWMGFAQQSLQTSVNAAKELMECKTLQEAMDLQSTYARAFFEEAVNEGSRLSEISTRVANEAFSPVRDSINTAMEKVWKAA